MIQFKRDTADNIADHGTYVLGDGQPFYNKTDKLLYIGDGATQVKNLEPLAGLNYLTMKDIWLSEYSSPTSDVEFSTSLFNRQPVAGDVALYFWKYSQQANVYAVTATVTSADDTSTYVEVSDYYSITGPAGPAGPTGLTYNNIYTETTAAPSDSLVIYPQVADFSRSPNVGESCAIYYQYQDDVWLCMVTIQNNNTEYCEAQIHEFTKVNGVDGKGILNSIKPQQLPNTWSTKTWNGLTSFSANNIWTDGENIYYSTGSSNHYVLNKDTSVKPILGGTYGDNVGQKLEDYEQDQFIKFGFMRVLDNNIAQLYNKSTGSPEYSRNYICFNGYGGEIEIYWDSDSHRSFKGPVVVIDVTPWGTNIVDYTGNTTSLGKGTDSGNILFAQTGASRWLIFRNNS